MSDEQDFPGSDASADEFGRVTEPGTFRIERLLPGPIERLWAYVTDPEKRRKWFGDGPVELRIGGKVGLQFRFDELSAEKTPPDKTKECDVNGRVTRCEPPRLLSYTWGEQNEASEVTFELFAHGQQVLLVITHRKLGDRGTMVSVASGWHTHLGLLIDHFDYLPARPFWSTKMRTAVEYERRFADLPVRFA
jgi:uncharacterized protein YndB with AHSA1/START domain